LIGVAVYLIPGVEDPAVLVTVAVACFFAGVPASRRVADIVGNELTWIAGKTKSVFQRHAHDTPDPSIVVIDEIVGMWISLLFLPKTLLAVGMAFLAFRFFDVIKPSPVRQCEQLPNGWGIMLDDIAAGAYANVTVHLVLFLFNASGVSVS
jgi:phosphatidylglycerophosphatase A